MEQAMETQRRLGPSTGQMARYGVRVQPPRDHRRGWAHPYVRPGDQDNQGRGGKSNSKGGGKSSSSNSGQGAGVSPYPSRERESATRRIQRLTVSKWDRSPTPGDTSGEEQEEDNRVTVTPLDEGQHAFVSSVLDRYRAGENLDWVNRHVEWGLRHRGDLFPLSTPGAACHRSSWSTPRTGRAAT